MAKTPAGDGVRGFFMGLSFFVLSVDHDVSLGIEKGGGGFSFVSLLGVYSFQTMALLKYVVVVRYKNRDYK